MLRNIPTPQRKTLPDKEIQELRQMVEIGVITKEMFKELSGEDF